HGRATATGLEVTCEWLEPWNFVLSLGEPGFIPTTAQGEDYEGVAISAPWALQPRSVVENRPDSQHVEFAAGVLAGMGLAMDQPLISQILSVDLDGDGVLEKLVTAQDSEITFDPVTEGYSVVFLRRLVGGAAETSIVEGEVVAPGTEGYTSHRAITGIADLNGDGRMEVVLSSHEWESGGIIVYELQGDHLVRVLGSGCGV
ncbi:MAG TPA: VCBS repeat-containing protein, partial [Acidimicrobiia bacterium]